LSSPADIALQLATQVEMVGSTTYELVEADHNKIKDCTHIEGCTVTVSAGLTSGIAGVPFTCGLSKGAAGNVEVVGDGVVVNAPGSLFTMTTLYGLMMLTEWPDSSFRLYGGTG
jgi:hypothetical protein